MTRGRLVLLLVRNSVSTDARVLRAARTAEESLGASALVLGVATDPTLEGEQLVEGVKVIRLAPWRIPLGLPRRISRRGSPPGPGAGGAPRATASSGPSLTVSRLSLRARLSRNASGLSFALQALRIARRLRPAVVHANDWNTMWAGLVIKLVCGCRLVYDSHELWPDRNGRWESRAWLVASEALFVRVADVVMTTSPGHAQAIAARYRTQPPLVVRNIPEWVASEPSTLVHPLVLYIGGLMPGRGLDQMIDALARLPRFTLRAVGPGSEQYRSGLLHRADQVGVADRVELRAPVPPSAIREQFRDAAIGLCLIQPICRSYELSLPNKLLEYVAGGLPILASDLPVISEIVRGSRLGEVVAPNDPDAIAAGAERLLLADHRATALRGIRAFATNNTWARERELLAAVYAPALAAG